MAYPAGAHRAQSLLLPLTLRLLGLVSLPAAGCNGDRGLPVGPEGPDAAIIADLTPAQPDAGERLPWDRDLSLTVRGLDGDEGRTAFVRVHYTVVDQRTPWRPVTIRGGIASVLLAGGFDSNTFGEFVELFVDRDGNGVCSEGTDAAWELFINNTFPMDGVVRADIDVMNPGPGSNRTRRCADLP